MIGTFSLPPTFRPRRLLRHPHAQTVVPFLLSSDLPHQAIQHQVAVGGPAEEADDVVVIHEDCPQNWTPGDRIVVLVHGLGGCHGSFYMMRIADKLVRRGIRVFRMDMRGCGAGLKLARGVFHAGRSDDLLAVVEHVATLSPKSGISICGFSLGANLTLKMLLRFAKEVPSQVDSVLVVSPPIDLGYCCERLNRGLGRIYDKYFVHSLWRDFVRRRWRLAGIDRVNVKWRPRTLLEFDHLVTSRLAGFNSALEYYQAASAGSDLTGIQIPTAVLVSADDPIVPLEIFKDVQLAEHVQLFVADGGGHLGFLAEAPVGRDQDKRWMDWRLIDWIQEAETAHRAGSVHLTPSDVLASEVI